jgi:glycosyltransferase involved in cell wall biosynthesis
VAVTPLAADLVESTERRRGPRPASGGRKANLVFLFPRQYRPLKPNFAKCFQNLSETFCGYIFTTSGERHRGLAIGNFRLYSERAAPSSLIVVLRRLWLQALLPLAVVRNGARVDAVVSYDPYASGLAASLLSTLLRARLIVEVRGDFHKTEPSQHPVKKRLMRLALAVSVHFADALRVLNRDQESYFRRRYPSKRVFRFSPFIAEEYFTSLDCYQGDYLLSVGHPYDLKGMDVVIKAFRLVAARHRGIKLKIMGYCPEDELRRYRELASGEPAIEFIRPGWIEDVGDLLRGCYALVNAARSEAFGRVHLEAMACQKPVVATRTNGAMECVEDGVTGLLCEIDNVADLAAQLDALLGDPARAARMGRAGFERFQRLYSERIYTQSVVSMIEEVLAREPDRRAAAPAIQP